MIATTAAPTALTPFQKFSATRSELSAALIEREEEIDITLTALVAQENPLFVGPPGTGKSMLSDAVVSWLHGNKFSILLTKFTTPEEVFGPLSVASLKLDKYRRITDGKMPEADVAFIDEIFKASSAILNTMLQMLNERTFRNDNVVHHCPLLLTIAASNEWPGEGEGGKELGALFDRFILRKTVRPIGAEKSLNRLLWSSNLTPQLSTTITPAEIKQATADALALPWDQTAQEAFLNIHKECKQEGIIPGDRRLRKAVRVVQAYAWLNGAQSVEPDHLEILAHVLWDDPAEQPRKVNEIVGRIANPMGMQINGLLMEAEQIIAATNVKDLGQAAAATKKLAEVAKKLRGVQGTRASNAFDYVQSEVKRIKMASIEM